MKTKRPKKYRKPEPIETTELCKYGCGNIAKYKSSCGYLICESSSNKCPINSKKNTKGLIKAHKDGKMRHDQLDGHRGWAKGLTAETNASLYNAQQKMKAKYASGELIQHNKGKHLTLETKQKLSISASERNNGYVKTKWFSVFCPYLNKEIKVQGTWELAYAKYLNDNNINWTRCNKIFLKYKIAEDSYSKKYIPDFYLIDSNEYIEIKGYWWKSADGRIDDRRKMNCVIEQNPNSKITILEQKQLKDLNII